MFWRHKSLTFLDLDSMEKSYNINPVNCRSRWYLLSWWKMERWALSVEGSTNPKEGVSLLWVIEIVEVSKNMIRAYLILLPNESIAIT